MDQNIELLSNPVSTVGSLILHGRIPPPVKMEYMGCAGKVESRATRSKG